MKAKQYTLTVITHDDGRVEMRRVNEGFDLIELAGYISLIQSEIHEQWKGHIKPDKIERQVVKKDELSMTSKLCTAYNLGKSHRARPEHRDLAYDNPYKGWEAKYYDKGFDLQAFDAEPNWYAPLKDIVHSITAYNEGRKAFEDGVTNNPYLVEETKYYNSWNTGYSDAKNKVTRE